jgi:mRNA interferase MazF
MITSAKNDPWPLDVIIKDLESTGLLAASVIRMKLFTLDNRYILRTIGKLSTRDQTSFNKALSTLLK